MIYEFVFKLQTLRLSIKTKQLLTVLVIRHCALDSSCFKLIDESDDVGGIRGGGLSDALFGRKQKTSTSARGNINTLEKGKGQRERLTRGKSDICST